MRFVTAAVAAGLIASAGAGTASADTSPIVHRVNTAVNPDTFNLHALLPARPVPGGPPAVEVRDCGGASATPVPDGQPIIVSMPPVAPFTVGQIDPSYWRNPPVSDNAWRLQFNGFMYLSALALRAYDDGSLTSLKTMVDQVVAFHQQDPDPGLPQYGWDEGTAQRRLSTEDCLYGLTHDARLIPGMMADVQVQMSSRYYGPPYHPVHNHGVMANQRLIRTGELLHNEGWVTFALDRLQREAPLAFSPQGMSWEQSSGYQEFNVLLWNQVADDLATRPAYAAAADSIRQTTAKGKTAEGWLTEPDGNYVQIGDADRAPGNVATAQAGVFRDYQAGYAIGRWSLTDPKTTYYTIRFGPKRRAHGHDDRGSLTWSTLGQRVLVGPGRYDYSGSAVDTWRTSPVAQNVAIPVAGAYNDGQPATVTGSTIQRTAHAYRVADRLYGTEHTRDIQIVDPSHRLVVKDSYAGGAGFRQVWHLDPAWQLVKTASNGSVLVFRTSSGLQLTITTTGRLSGLQHGSTSPFAGWNFPVYGTMTPAYQITIRSAVPSVTTTFTVTDPAGQP